MRRFAGVAAMACAATFSLTGCGLFGNEYCDSIEANLKTLETYGSTESNAAYEKLADTLEEVAKVAPDNVKSDYEALAKATRGVLSAHKKAGVTLEEVKKDPVAANAKLTTEQRNAINTARTAFNPDRTADERASVVTSIKQECEITLK